MGMELKYASWDPGGARKKRTTGLVKWDTEGKPRIVEELNEEELDTVILEMEDTIRVFIIERYVPRSGVSHTGNKLLTAQVIGNLKGHARRNNIEVVEQNSSVLKIASMWAQVKVPKGHMPDKMSAYLHGYYYLHQQGIISAKVFEEYS